MRADVPNDALIMKGETFGPVAAIAPFVGSCDRARSRVIGIFTRFSSVFFSKGADQGPKLLSQARRSDPIIRADQFERLVGEGGIEALAVAAIQARTVR